jgi:AhpD family alkylhydroperoxidase
MSKTSTSLPAVTITKIFGRLEHVAFMDFRETDQRAFNRSNRKGETLMYDMANLKKLKALGNAAPKAMDAFWAFDKAAMEDGAVPKKYKELIALGVALTTQCPYCLEIHRGRAVTAGATPEEIAETALVAAALRAGGAVTHASHLVVDGVETHG